MQKILISIIFISSVILFLQSIINKNTLIKKQTDIEITDNAKMLKLFSYISHELRTPVIGIVGIIEMMQQNIDNKEKIKEHLEKMERSAKYLNSLIDEVIDISKIKNENKTTGQNILNISDIMDNCIEMTNERFKDRKIDYIKSLENIKNYNLIGDELHLCQVFVNILSNAVKFTQDGGYIIFNVQELSEEKRNMDNKVYYKFQIIDNGVGMNKEFLNNIWEEFAQDNNSINSKYKSSGLGMYITKQLIEKMNGNISVESELGKGTTFTINVPLGISTAVSNCNKNVISINQEKNDIKPLKIILAEDDELNIEIEKHLLEKEGMTVNVAKNGKEAVKMFEKSKTFEYDAILMDVNMPIMNGYDATKIIRSLEREDARKIPVIAMSANSCIEEASKIKESGVSQYLTKPIETSQIIKILEKIKVDKMPMKNIL